MSGEAAIEIDHAEPAAVGRGLDNSRTFVEGQAQWFLDEDMLAGAKSAARKIGVAVVLCRHDERINGRVSEHFIDVPSAVICRQENCSASGVSWSPRNDRAHSALRDGTQGWNKHRGGEGAGSNQGNAE
jgi:hypothetical protein